jgi:hypothetical protein
VHQLGVVQHPLGVEHVEVLLEELSGADPLRSAGGLAGRDDVDRVHAQLPGPGEHGPDLRGEGPGGEGRASESGQAARRVSRLPCRVSRTRNSCSGPVSSRAGGISPSVSGPIRSANRRSSA